MADRDIAHADIAGWVLGALDPDESERFQAHLETCDECQREVAELSPSARRRQPRSRARIPLTGHRALVLHRHAAEALAG